MNITVTLYGLRFTELSEKVKVNLCSICSFTIAKVYIAKGVHALFKSALILKDDFWL